MRSVDVSHVPAAVTRLTVVVGVLAAVALGGCDRDAERSVERAKQSTESTAAELGASAREVGRNAGQAIEKAADAVAEKSRQVADEVKDKSRDLAITTAVNARLASDASLSALRINVDTDDGHVKLGGTAPDTASRSRATELARTVQGVTSVVNELTVQRQP